MKQVKFNGTGAEYFKIWIINLILCIITFGIYYPWAKVRTRRYFYANTEYADRFFDYHATGKQLFFGYLIGVCILIVLNIISAIFPTAGFILPVILFFFVPWIIWRSLKFNMRMTSFSNVRFSFDGSLKTAYFIYMLIPIAIYIAIIVLMVVGFASMAGFSNMSDVNMDSINTGGIVIFGIAVILALVLMVYMTGLLAKKSAEYQIGETRFGQGRFFINVNTKTFVMIAFKTALISVVSLVLFMTFIGLSFSSMLSGEVGGSVGNSAASSFFMGSFFIVYIGFIAASLFAAAYTYSRQRQYIYANTTLDQTIRFKSSVGAKAYFGVLITNMLLIIVTLGFGMPWAKVRVAQYLADNTWIDAEDMDINQYLTQKEQHQSAIGEEIGDVLDIDINIAI
ncbi:YjgN family protein [Psychrobacter sp. FDAARGOS_221]|uniref:YjgN family protein n=1 Tax=Psychrobacter sp. FDAARGOS_221 TaxID=1975705 RepID=UPI000BB59D35|nr:YjgN family protein [Psychrobacter sp. FDAARGOS_221]PNK61935.1 DUF898 domain-containing protein [Psychrobacter sp. FDAARGOS_221]